MCTLNLMNALRFGGYLYDASKFALKVEAGGWSMSHYLPDCERKRGWCQ